jgi:histone-lysine N-methyltransferase SETD8
MSKKSKPQVVVRDAGPDKGEGTFAVNHIEKGAIVCEYQGELISEEDFLHKGGKHFPPDIDDWSCAQTNYVFFFKSPDRFGNLKTWGIDADAGTGPGRKINHSIKNKNVKPIVVKSDPDKPQLFFTALRDIMPGEELLYDYGEREKDALEKYPFLKH